MNAPISPRLLVVDDEPDLLTLYALTLAKLGYQVEAADTLSSAKSLLAQQRFDVLITDMRLPDGLGLDLVKELCAQRRPEKAIVITAYGSADNAVEALKAGAFDYLTKPVEPKRLRAAVAAALSHQSNHSPQASQTSNAPSNLGAAPAPLAAAALARIIGQSAAMVQVKQRIQRVAPTMAPVLVLGESGTGKELVARALHACSHRASGPLVAVNCGAIPENLMEAEFFGVRKGAYTGATADRPGYFQAAQGGTLFLDEIGDLPMPMQAKLLRAIQERQVRPLGSAQEEDVDLRIVSATHRDLVAGVRAGTFRQDLYYRLNVVDVCLPPLRDRPDDLPLVAQGLLHQLAQRHGQAQAPQLTGAATQLLAQLPFPGNIRELENLLERALAMHPGPVLDADCFDPPNPTRTLSPQSSGSETPAPAAAGHPQPIHGDPDRTALEHWLQHHRWNQSRTAKELGWTLAKLRYWMQRLGLGE
jgi:two-component system response regulator PilR (NtrC family)